MKYNGFYFWMFKGPMKKVLAKKYGKAYVLEVMKKSKQVYRELVEQADDIGDDNPMAYKGKAENKKSIVRYAKWYTPEKEKQYPTSFKVDFDGQPYEGACYYRITRCPICIYMERMGIPELMPLFCELDEVMISLQHGILHRKQTLANGGEYCDYFITGNKE